MTDYREGHPKFEILPPDERAGPPADTRGGAVPPKYDFSGVETGWLARRRGRALGRALEEQAGGLKVAKRWAEAAADFERARQQLELARARRQLLPMMLEEEHLRLETEIAKRRGELQAAADLYGDHRARRAERREMEAETHALELARRRRLILEEQLSIKRLEERLDQGNPEPERSAKMADADPLGDFIRAELEVRRAQSAAARVVDAIRSAAAAEGRDSTPQEADLIEMYEAAAGAAEERIRRGEAADF